jgi:hypothetical protein
VRYCRIPRVIDTLFSGVAAGCYLPMMCTSSRSRIGVAVPVLVGPAGCGAVERIAAGELSDEGDPGAV